MRTLATIALRNLVRHLRRSLLTGASIAAGVACTLVAVGILNGFLETIIRLTVETSLGAIQIHRAGFNDAEEPLKLDFAEDDPLIASVQSVPNVQAVAPRITFDGLINNGRTASVVVATAIVPELELKVCPGRKEMLEGATLGLEEMVLGAELATSLALEKGNGATMLSASQRGVANALDATVSGVMQLGLPLQSKTIGIVSLAFAQRLLRMPKRVTMLALSVVALDRLEETAAALKQHLGERYDVETWREREPGAAAGIDRFAIIIQIIVVVLFLLVGASVMNAMLMSVDESVREIGTMMAVGTKRSQVLGIVLIEAWILGIFAGIVGVVVGVVLNAIFHRTGLTFQPRSASVLLVRPFTSALFVLGSLAGAQIGAVLAALYPAWKASRLSPVDALRSI